MDLVQRIVEGLVNTPDAVFDSCQINDFRNREAVVGSDLWWERTADPDGAAVRLMYPKVHPRDLRRTPHTHIF